MVDFRKVLVILFLVIFLVGCNSETVTDKTLDDNNNPNQLKNKDNLPKKNLDQKKEELESSSPEYDELSPKELNRPEDLQIGLNFIRFHWSTDEALSGRGLKDMVSDYVQPSSIFNDFEDLGVHTFRQFSKVDLLWGNIEPEDDQWDFSATDEVITNSNFEPIPTLFSLQYASPTPVWSENDAIFQKVIGEEAEEYLEVIVNRYGDYVKYWELGNEMEHWIAADDPVEGTKLPSYYPRDGFSPQEQGIFLKQVSDYIRENDPDAIIVLPGMGGLGDHTLEYWLPGVIEGAGGSDWFDVVNYHFYSSWESYTKLRPKLDSVLSDLGIEGKEIWLTETGSTSSETLTLRTDYPNSEDSQSADVFRRIIQAYGYGDDAVFWHTYIGSSGGNNDWRDYGIRDGDGSFKPSYYSFKLLVEELIPFENVEMIASKAKRGENSYLINTKLGDDKYVVWGSGFYTIPEGMTEMASVIPNEDNLFDWETVEEGDVIELSGVPNLIK